MKNKLFIISKIVFVSVGLFMSLQVILASDKKGIQVLNNALIFDLFMNLELAEKNGNLATIVDFIPNANTRDFNTVKITSDIGVETQTLDILYNKKGLIETISYAVNNKIYNYEFIYNDNQLAFVNIAGKKKISLEYNNGRLIKITRDKGDGFLEYNFEYLETENKANILLNVIQGEKKSPSKHKYYATWNNQFQINSFRINAYSSKAINYTENGDLLSYSFVTANSDNNEAKWEYNKIDDKGNWIERKSNNTIMTRTINYK